MRCGSAASAICLVERKPSETDFFDWSIKMPWLVVCGSANFEVDVFYSPSLKLIVLKRNHAWSCPFAQIYLAGSWSASQGLLCRASVHETSVCSNFEVDVCAEQILKLMLLQSKF